MASENNWEPSRVSAAACEWRDIPGADARMQFLAGDVADLMAAFAGDYNAFVEPIFDADCASYTPTNSVPTSNHLNATAMDIRWNSHPFKRKGTFTAAQVATIRDIQAFYTVDGVLLMFWAGDWRSPIDEMHWQLGYDTYASRHLIRKFLDTRVRADGFSTYRRGGTPRGGGAPAPTVSGGLTPAVLARIMDNRVPMARYESLYPRALAAMDLAQLTTVKRRAMFWAQLGHESGGLKWQEEIADGSAYEGRKDLGNTQPGDGRRYKGRDFIQITGRHNYAALSQWAHRMNEVPTPTFFVDHPEALATDQYAFLGAVWYWTVGRPQLNTLADAGDMDAATRAINGGLNGLADRRSFYSRALAAGNDLMTPINYLDAWEMLMADETKDQSRSIYRTDNDRVFTARDMVFNVDSMAHAQLVETAAIRGEGWALDLVAKTALGTGAGARLWWDPNQQDVWAINHARHLLQMIEASNPSALTAYLGKA